MLQGSHGGADVDISAVSLRVLSLRVTSVENASNGSHDIGAVVHSLVLQILRYPASVYDNSCTFALSVQVSVERCDDIDSFLSIALFRNLDLLTVVKDAPDLNGLHGPFLLELIDVVGGGPNVLAFVGWSDISWSLGHKSSPTLSLNFLLLTTTALILGSLMHED
jgi:hypothetical protein